MSDEHKKKEIDRDLERNRQKQREIGIQDRRNQGLDSRQTELGIGNKKGEKHRRTGDWKSHQ